MRRNRISQSCPVNFRSGVILKVTNRKVKVQSPVEWVMTSIGLAPSLWLYAFHPSRASGPRHARKTTGLNQRVIGRNSEPQLLKNSSSNPSRYTDLPPDRNH